ncbi:Hypothetical protein R9X50_00017500 [Acrodontium crateriforme]|uniref:Vps41 beta-propeller domain-containing protein n=1 Tax=Acrodontium crateriforme TaxID=150365 RepID=A0AAQ3M063_9PEZI|nr:Hypothetical protein R9X50_00017500 [Acrodontium crateriforme]
MSAEPRATGNLGQHDSPADTAPPELNNNKDPEGTTVEDEEAEDDDEEEEEPKLKYASLTGSLTSIYRNGDSTSAFVVAGDKMAMGTHSGNIHILALPAMQVLRTYHAHNATVTSVSISPTPPPPSALRSEAPAKEIRPPEPLTRKASTTSTATASARGAARPRVQQPTVPNTPNNQIFVATSSLDGHVCVSSLVDSKDVLLRNFARPVQAVALSPDYKNDRTYLSGGLAGNLILTVGGKAGVSSDANTNSAAAAASGWLGSIGLGGNVGKDTILHSGEGSISTIKWSLTGKWVVWVNEEGIKIMRSHLKLGSEQSEDAWRRIAHAAKPNRRAWQDMAGVWKARAEWIDDRKLETDEGWNESGQTNGVTANGSGTKPKTVSEKEKNVEKLVVGWGDTAWVLHVIAGGTALGGRHAGERQVGSADIVHKLQFRDCIISGITLHTPSMLAILAYRTRDDDDKPINSPESSEEISAKKPGGRKNRRTGLAPQLRLINVANGEEVDLDELSISRFETLSAQDYHLNTLYIPPPLPKDKPTKEQKGALEAVWEASGGALGAGYAQRMFSSSASVLSRSSSKDDSESVRGGLTSAPKQLPAEAHPYAAESGLKIFIQSPYDCVLAVKRDHADHLAWLLEHENYEEAWQLIEDHPSVVDPSTIDQSSTFSSDRATPSRGHGHQASLADFFADDASQSSLATGVQSNASAVQKEKCRIGDLWLQQLVSKDRWEEAGRTAGKVLGASSRWDHWVWTFAQANKFDEITPYIPSTTLRPPLPSLVYEVVLGHYISTNQPEKVRQLLEVWDPDLFDVGSVIKAVEARLESGETSGQKKEDPDRRILLEALAKLYIGSGQVRQALRCFIDAQNAEAAFNLIREEKLMDGIGDDIPGFILLRVTNDQLKNATLAELEEASSEAMQLLALEAYRGTVAPENVIQQLQKSPRARALKPFLYMYFRALWLGLGDDDSPKPKGSQQEEGRALVQDHADLAVELFADYNRDLLMTFLRSTSVYSYDKATTICEQNHYIPELVYILSKTGQTKRALFLIIGELSDVSQAIDFAKENPDLWDDLLDYSMDKPRFIRGLLNEVGTAINPIDLVRRIPEGLEIEGLREGLGRIVREYQVQYDISEGVARVLRGEVVAGMDTLRAGQKKAVRFEVVHESETDIELTVHDVPTKTANGEIQHLPKPVEEDTAKPGHCVGCGDPFSEYETEPLIGFACGHVYHLSCLLRANPETSDPTTIERLLGHLEYGKDAESSEGDGSYAARSVRSKVAHAHVIQNVVEGGCRRCIALEGA